MTSTRPSHLRDETTLSSSASSASAHGRDSNMVRASVLDVALQLGFGGPNSAVADWIFNNPVDEEEEPDEAPIPELTPSSATSEDSHSNGHTYPYTPLSAGAPLNQSYIRATAPFQYPDSLSSSKFKNQRSAGSSIEQHSDITPSPSPLPMPFSNMAPSIAGSSSSKQSSGTKLRKARITGSGYESEGHISDGGRSKKEIEKIRKEIEAKTVKAAEKEAKAAAKEAKKEEKIKKSKSKRGKKDRSKSPINGDITDYETDIPSDGGYLSETVSLSPAASYKKTKPSSKSSDSDKPKKSPSFFRRKAKHTDVVPPMPSIPFSTSASTSPPTSSGLGSDSAVSLPPIAARFATTSATPPPTLAPSMSSLTLPAPSPHPSPLPSPSLSVRPRGSPVPSIPGPTHTTNITTTSRNSEPPTPADEVDDTQSTTASSRSSDISMPASLPTSTSTSSHRKPGFFKFGGSNENIKAKPTISLPLTRSLAAGSPTSRGASPMPGTPSSAPVSNNGFLARKPVLEVQTHDFGKSASPREISPVQSTSSYTSATHLPSPLVQSSSARVLSPILAPASTFKKSRPTILEIQHPYEYNGSQTMEPSLPSPRRPNLAPVPPPTPPPTGPLPRVPPLTTKSGTIRGPPSAPPLVAPPPIPAVAPAPSPLQRGKEVPFPTMQREPRPGRLEGLQGMMDVPRYRGLPGFDNEHGANGNGNSRGANVGRQQQPFSAFSTDSEEDEGEGPDPDVLTSEFQQIRQRFYDHDRERASVPVTEPDRYKDSFAGGESFSYQHTDSIAFSADPEPHEEQDESTRKLSDDRSMYADDDKSAGRRTMYELEGRDSRHYDDESRISRYSATQSVYSVMDDEKSGEARQRFLNRVAAMYGEGGREVPPVPKLPEGLIIKGTGVGRRRIDA